MRLFPAVLAATLACAHAPPSDEAGPIVDDVRIEGVRSVDTGDIEDGLATRGTGIWPWQGVQRLDPVALETDQRRIETFLRLHGFYQARAVAEQQPDGERVDVVFHVEEGVPAKLGTLTIAGLEPLPPEVRDRVLADLPLIEGKILLAGDYQATLDRLRHRLLEAGYARAVVAGRVDVHPEHARGDAHISVKPGPRVHYGELIVQGLHTLPEGPVRAIARREAPVGERYSPAALDNAEGRIYSLGAFDGVRVALADGGSEDASSDAAVLVVVDEAPAHAVTAGGGLGIEQNLHQVQLLAEYRNVNLFGGLRRLVWHNELALRFLPSFFRPTRRGLGGESALELTQPEILPRTDAAVRAACERIFLQSFESNAVTGRVGFPYHLARQSLLVPSLNYERYFGVVGREELGPRPPSLSATCPSPCALSYLGLLFSLDRRADPLSPRTGFLAEVDLQYATGLLGGNFHDVRVLPQLRFYLPVARSLVFATRVKVGALFNLGDTRISPIVQRFFGGGEGGHRGFGSEQLSPLIEAPGGELVPIGGDGLWLATAELRLRFTDTWGMVAFADYGDVTLEPLVFDFRRAHLAAGVGARYYSIVGPVRLDVAYRVDRRARRAFDTGAVAEQGTLDFIAFFISLGEAF